MIKSALIACFARAKRWLESVRLFHRLFPPPEIARLLPAKLTPPRPLCPPLLCTHVGAAESGGGGSGPHRVRQVHADPAVPALSLIHISEPTRPEPI
eukprot:4762906-Pyramimonas_sp.AAC.1